MTVKVIALTPIRKWPSGYRDPIIVGERVSSARNLGMSIKKYREGVPGEKFTIGPGPDLITGYWEAAGDFQTTLRVEGPHHNGALSLVDTANNRHHLMFPSDVAELLQNADVVGGEVTGEFRYVNHGGVIGIQLITP